MVQFYNVFQDERIVPTLSGQLSWSHFIELLPLKSDEEREYYISQVTKNGLSVRELRNQISRKSFERREIANVALTEASRVPFNLFKDPYLLDILDLKDNHLEADLEKAILKDLEAFMLEFGNGFSFIARQKRMQIGDEVVILDLLFYNRKIKRLVAVELKIGEFKAAYKGQMELYLKWLDRYEKEEGEQTPIGIILCTSASRDKVEMLELDKSGIAVAEYWSAMPPKEIFEEKVQQILIEAKERLARRESFEELEGTKEIEYFYEPKAEDEV